MNEQRTKLIDACAASVRQFGRKCQLVRAPVGRPTRIGNAWPNRLVLLLVWATTFVAGQATATERKTGASDLAEQKEGSGDRGGQRSAKRVPAKSGAQSRLDLDRQCDGWRGAFAYRLRMLRAARRGPMSRPWRHRRLSAPRWPQVARGSESPGGVNDRLGRMWISQQTLSGFHTVTRV